MRKIRVGLLVDTPCVPAWTYRMLERIKAGDYASIEVIVEKNLQPAKKPKSHTTLRNLAPRIYRKILELIQTRIMDSVRVAPNAFAPKEIGALLPDVPVLAVSPIRRNRSISFTDGDLDRLRRFDLDVLIRLGGFGILRGQILNLPKYGIWSYHHGDNQVNRGGPAGYWESALGWPSTGTTLQILTEDLDNGKVLSRSWSCTAPGLGKNKNRIYWKSPSILPRKLEELYRIGEEAFFAKVEKDNEAPLLYSNRLFVRPTNAELTKLLLKNVVLRARRKLIEFFYFEQWCLMFDLKPDISSSFWRFKKIVPPKDRFWADPYPIYRDGRYYIYIEEYMFDRRKGHIALITMDEEGNYDAPVTVLHRPYHLSFPFLFEWRGQMYMMPETDENKTLEVYRCVRFPDVWEFEKNLMEDVVALDATLFFHDDKWWLFMNMVENEGASSWDELFLFFSDSPLSDTWTAHPANPIVSDVRKSRSAGRIFRRNGRIYRPAQNCAPHYGYGFVLNEIARLTETEYEENVVTAVEPNWDDDLMATHTFNFDHRLTVIDGKLRRRR